MYSSSAAYHTSCDTLLVYRVYIVAAQQTMSKRHSVQKSHNDNDDVDSLLHNENNSSCYDKYTQREREIEGEVQAPQLE